MSSEGIHLKKCPQCGEYTDGGKDNCSNCNFELNKAHREEIKKRRSVDDIHIPIWKVNQGDPIWLQALKRPVQLVQLALYGIVAFFIYLATAFAH